MSLEILRNNSCSGKASIETVFVRMSSMHSQYYQHYLSTNWGYEKLTKHFFVDCDVCYGYRSSGHTIQSGLQTVIMLNCQFSSYNGMADYNGANPKIYIENTQENQNQCYEFIDNLRNANISVIDLTIQVLCEQLNLIQIEESEKFELIQSFAQRNQLNPEEVASALSDSGMDHQKYFQSNTQYFQSIIRDNSYSGINPVNNNNANRSEVQTAFVRLSNHNQFSQYYLSTDYSYSKLIRQLLVDCSVGDGYQHSNNTVNSNLETVLMLNCTCNRSQKADFYGANPQIHIEIIDDSCREFIASEKAAGRNIVELTIKVLCEQLKLIYIQETEKLELILGFIKRNNIPNEVVLEAMTFSGYYNVLNTLVKQEIDISAFVQKKKITDDQLATALINSGLSDDQILLALTKSKLNLSTFALKKGISNDQIMLTLSKKGYDISNFAHKHGISNNHVLLLLMRNKVDYSTFACSKSISNEQILETLAKSGEDYQTFAKSKGFTNQQILIILMKAKVDIQHFTTAKNISNTKVIEIIQNSDLPLQEKYKLLKQINPVDLRTEQQNVNNKLIKHELDIVIDRVLKFLITEYEFVNERVIQFVNNKQCEIALELAFKEALLQSKQNEDDSATNEIFELKKQNQNLQDQNLEIKLQYEQQIADIKTSYAAELIKCKNEIESSKKQYQQDLILEYKKYQVEIEQLNKAIEAERQTKNKIVELQLKQRPADQDIDVRDSITNQLQLECQLLRQQLIDEKQFNDNQQQLTLQLISSANKRNTELQKQLTEEKMQRLSFFQQLQQKESETTKLLEENEQQQATKIYNLEKDYQSLQINYRAQKAQVEQLNVQEYQKLIDKLKIQLEDKEQYISKLQIEIDQINMNKLQQYQVENVLTIFKTVTQ
ncbi:Hypothetical_protein [Hexamita inflata]|uniref:Hypothetical_protein n=1 Tax=Hexamita inflata TaxID=28002 RepID=A0AA86RB31_9EUKA|nr:Hypothetical protein HINF_LOCUS62794 [Hexamita inflata]